VHLKRRGNREKKSCKYKTELALRMTNTNKVVTLRSARGANYQTHPSIPASSLRSPKRKGEVGGEGSRAGREGRGRRELAAAAIRGGQPRSPRRAEFFFLILRPFRRFVGEYSSTNELLIPPFPCNFGLRSTSDYSIWNSSSHRDIQPRGVP
jgi:hypothetical protein